MKTEYLITFDSSDEICVDVEGFKTLLTAHKSITFNEKPAITYRDAEFPYSIASGQLPDGSVYYDLTLECIDISKSTDFSDLLRDIRKLCNKSSSRQVIVLFDGIGGLYCEKGYPVIYKTENLLRKLISKFMAISIGTDWAEKSVPKEVIESVRGERRNAENLLFEVDFIQLSNFLFKKYTKSDAGKLLDSIKGMQDGESIRVENLRHYVPFTNWEKYFAQRVKCTSEYLSVKWEKLYDYRCKIAHCRILSEKEYEDLVALSDDVCEKIQQALDSIGDLHIALEEREDLAENISSAANVKVAEFIGSFNKLVVALSAACEKASGPNDIYAKHETNKTNIRMQANYLATNKGLIDIQLAKKIEDVQIFRNLIVHKFGLFEVDSNEINNHMSVIELAINALVGVDASEYERLKNVNLKSKNENPSVQ